MTFGYETRPASHFEAPLGGHSSGGAWNPPELPHQMSGQFRQVGQQHRLRVPTRQQPSACFTNNANRRVSESRVAASSFHGASYRGGVRQWHRTNTPGSFPEMRGKGTISSFQTADSNLVERDMYDRKRRVSAPVVLPERKPVTRHFYVQAAAMSESEKGTFMRTGERRRQNAYQRQAKTDTVS